MAARYISIIVRAVKLEYFVSMFFFSTPLHLLTFFFLLFIVLDASFLLLSVCSACTAMSPENYHTTAERAGASAQDQWLSITLNPNEYNPLICNPIIYYGI